MSALEMVRLRDLMARGSGSRDVTIALIDGPVYAQHPDLRGASITSTGEGRGVGCRLTASAACLHATFVAGILVGARASSAPAICPGCTLLVRPIFVETSLGRVPTLTATPTLLARAIIECVRAGARVINMSLAMLDEALRLEHAVGEALDVAARRGVIVVAAAGNQGTLTSSAITRHPWVIPVVACTVDGRPMDTSNLGCSIGRHGLRAPGERIVSLDFPGASAAFAGTSVATPFVAGTVALLWSEFPAATAAQIVLAVTQPKGTRRSSVTPPLLDATAAYDSLLHARRH